MPGRVAETLRHQAGRSGRRDEVQDRKWWSDAALWVAAGIFYSQGWARRQDDGFRLSGFRCQEAVGGSLEDCGKGQHSSVWPDGCGLFYTEYPVPGKGRFEEERWFICYGGGFCGEGWRCGFSEACLSINDVDEDARVVSPDLGGGGDVIECGECFPERVEAEVDREVKKLGDPRLPTAKEKEDHERTHLPFRNWCYHCVRGKGKDLDHRKAVEEERGLSEYSFDYCFPGDEFGFKLTVLVGREKTTGMTMGTVVPAKGSSGRFAAEKIVEFMEECGDGGMDVIIKSDQEASIQSLVKEVVEVRGDTGARRTIIEQSPVGSSGSNGVVERAAQTIEGQIRVMKSALEG